jgi:hypothetical protein
MPGLLDDMKAAQAAQARGAMSHRRFDPVTGRQMADAMQSMGLLASPIPVVGDVAGLLGDAAMYAAKPEERTMGNFAMTALGALPFVPSVAGAANRAGLTKGFSSKGLLDRDLYHGSNQIIDRLNPNKYGSNTGADDAMQAFWAAGHEADANRYAELAVDKFGGAETMHRLRAQAKNPLVIGVEGDSTVRGKLLEKLLTNKEAAFAYARKYGHDAVVWPIGNANDSDFTVAVLDPKSVNFLDARVSKANKRAANTVDDFDWSSVPSSIWD